MFKPGLYNPEIFKGSDYDLPVTFSGIFDLTGWSAEALFFQPRAGGVSISCTVANSRIVIEIPEKRITVHLTTADVASINWAIGKFWMKLTNPSGATTRFLEGEVHVVPENS